MTGPTFEQALAVVKSLPLEDKQRLRQWLIEEESKLAGQNGADAPQSALHREKEMQWLNEHEAEYAGQWLALDGDRLLSHGEDPHKARAEARAMGVETPFVVFAENPDEYFTGGWL
ncbi:MAG TPA: DUF5678 domain-containing protein [Blastocatellia bacterium]|nr:DUF5678 domain-containing protein [Blastocatellia bacterium]